MICTIAERPGYSKTHRDETGLRQTILAKLMQLIADGCTEFMVNCERGVPLWAAEAVCLLKQHCALQLHLVIPFEEQCRDWSECERNRYYAVHALADTVTFASKPFTPDCYSEAERRMAEQSDLILLFGSQEEPFQLMRYANANHVEIRCVG